MSKCVNAQRDVKILQQLQETTLGYNTTVREQLTTSEWGFLAITPRRLENGEEQRLQNTSCSKKNELNTMRHIFFSTFEIKRSLQLVDAAL